jgi:hypothetical protein
MVTGEFLTIDVSSDIEDVIKNTDIFFYAQIPYAFAVAMNNTAFDIRRRVVETTWENAFMVRNKRFPGRLFRVDKVTLGGPKSKLRGFKSGAVDFITAAVFQSMDRDYTKQHAEGGTKTPVRGTIAIPKNPHELRTRTGRIAKAKKPRNITDKRDHFMIRRGGQKHLILRRTGEQTEVVYSFKNRAKINKSFRFYEDAFDTVERVFPGHFHFAFQRAINSSRFRASG